MGKTWTQSGCVGRNGFGTLRVGRSFVRIGHVRCVAGFRYNRGHCVTLSFENAAPNNSHASLNNNSHNFASRRVKATRRSRNVPLHNTKRAFIGLSPKFLVLYLLPKAVTRTACCWTKTNDLPDKLLAPVLIKSVPTAVSNDVFKREPDETKRPSTPQHSERFEVKS